MMKIPSALNQNIRITVLELLTQLMKSDEKTVWIKHAIGFCEQINIALSVATKYEEQGQDSPLSDDTDAETYFQIQYLMLNLQSSKDKVFRSAWLNRLEALKAELYNLKPDKSVR